MNWGWLYPIYAPDIYHTFAYYQWVHFFEQPQPANLSWVRVFYVNINMVSQAIDHSWMHSHAIHYDDAAINSLFHIPVPKEEAPIVSFEQLDEFLGTQPTEWINRHLT